MFGYSANNSYFCVVKIASSSEVAFFTGVSVLFLAHLIDTNIPVDKLINSVPGSGTVASGVGLQAANPRLPR